MSAWQLFLSGFLCTLSVAMPPGPVALLCLERTILERFRVGLMSGAGAATVHSCYAALIISGANWVGDGMRAHGAAAQAVGGAVLILLAFRGTRAMRAPPRAGADAAPGVSLVLSWATAAIVALSNPMTILGLAASAGSLGLFAIGPRWEAIAGGFLGSMLWWLTLCGAATLFRRQATPALCATLGRIAFVVMIAFGLIAVSRAAWVVAYETYALPAPFGPHHILPYPSPTNQTRTKETP
jgi:threonine/homoserine/homoserine lactone efflux protein